MSETITVEAKSLGWESVRPDGYKRSVEYIANVMKRWAERHAHRRRWLHVPPQAEYQRDPYKRETRIQVTLDYAELP